MNKYYIPDIKEFNVGFEFEFNPTDVSFENRTGFTKHAVIPEENYKEKLGYCTLGWIQMFFHVFKTDEDKKEVIRVKYLDKDDIESLGFKLIREFKNENIIEWLFEKEFDEYELNIQLIYTLDSDKNDWHFSTQNICIFSTDKIRHPDDESCLFDGTIKNKSNLKDILVNNLHYKI